MSTSNWRPSFAWSLWLALTLAAGPGGAAGPAKPKAAEPVTTTVKSERMTVQNKEHRAVFEGEVVLTRGDLVVRSDVMVVFYEPREREEDGSTTPGANTNGGERASPMSVNKIEASGRVRIEKPSGTATCRKAVFYQKEHKIVLTGNPVAWQGNNRVTGDRITMFLDEDRTLVEGGSRVLLEEAGGSGP